MKWIEWLVVLSLVAIGLACLTMSATAFLDTPSIQPYLHMLVRICLWIGLPVLVVGLGYWIWRWKR
ncbi:hypothetical protein JOE21_000028 [Desmospora profundinema]|uniref:Uncharacterized protein n=1 Tax=Desmospora profundinema TaxID=1571184 RepID=A0ABU1IGY3_9BACL|nr:hypothetical protein [Desmospora profundinema]